MLRIAVLWIFACSNLFVNYPLIKHKGTVVNHVLWLTPAIAMFSDDMMRNREQALGQASIVVNQERLLEA